MDKNLNVEIRTDKGKNINRRLRNSGFIPAVLYSHGESEAIKVAKKEFYNLFHGHISESVIFDVNISGKKEESKHMAYVKDYQEDPVSGEILHIDLFRVTLGEKIQTKVPVEIIGTPVGIKMGGIMDISEREISVECLPKNLPSKIEVDVTDLDIGDSIHVKDLNLGEEITLLVNEDNVIVAVHLPKVVVEEVEEEEILEGEEGAEETDEEGAEETAEK